MRQVPSPLLVVTDRHQAGRPLEAIVSEAVSAGARWFWLRDRDLEPAARRQLAFRLAEIVREVGGLLSIGGDIALAAEAGCGAIHLRNVADVAQARHALGRSAFVGMSAHSVAEVEDACAAGADYVTLSPIYVSASKPGYGPPLGPAILKQAAACGIPVLALGGVTVERIAECRSFGAAGVAVMGSVMRATRPGAVVEELLLRLSQDAHG